MYFQKDENYVLIDFSTYFDDFGNRNYAFFRIVMIKIRTELPILTIKAHEAWNEVRIVDTTIYEFFFLRVFNLL